MKHKVQVSRFNEELARLLREEDRAHPSAKAIMHVYHDPECPCSDPEASRSMVLCICDEVEVEFEPA